LPKVVTQRCLEQNLNPRPTDCKPKCLTRCTTAPPFDRLRYSITELISVMCCQCTSMQWHYCVSESVCSCRRRTHASENIRRIQSFQCRQSYKYIRFPRPYCYFRLSVVVAIICEHFFELATVGKIDFLSTVTTILSLDL